MLKALGFPGLLQFLGPPGGCSAVAAGRLLSKVLRSANCSVARSHAAQRLAAVVWAFWIV
jgi:hypothetical protein